MSRIVTDINGINYDKTIDKIQELIKTLDMELTTLCDKKTLSQVNSKINKILGSPQKTTNSSNLPDFEVIVLKGDEGGDVKKEIEDFREQIARTKAEPEPPKVNKDILKTCSFSEMYRDKVMAAYKHKKIFIVYGNYNNIRRSLLRRGWLEKFPPSRFQKLQSLSDDILLQHARKGNEYEAVLMSKFMAHFPAFFVWQPKRMRDNYADVLPYRNRIRRSNKYDFSTKVGLIGCAEHEFWFRQPGICGMSYPRFYRLAGGMEERQMFIEDFRYTQCRCLLRWLCDNINEYNKFCSPNGSIPISMVEFALQKVRQELDKLENEELDSFSNAGAHEAQTEKFEWNNFLVHSQNLIQKKELLNANIEDLQYHLDDAKILLQRLEEIRPDYGWDGYKNLWILKPGYAGMGHGIVIRNNLHLLLAFISNNMSRKYIAQKYIGKWKLKLFKKKIFLFSYCLPIALMHENPKNLNYDYHTFGGIHRVETCRPLKY